MSAAAGLRSALQLAIDGARSLVDAEMGTVAVIDRAGALDHCVASGIAESGRALVGAIRRSPEFLCRLSELDSPLQIGDFAAYCTETGLAEPGFSGPVGPAMAVPITRRGVAVGAVLVANARGGRRLSTDDAAMLSVIASQTALMVENSHRADDVDRAKASLQTLIDTSPVGVLLFDDAGRAVRANREALKMVESLHSPDESPARLLEIMTIRREDGRVTSLVDHPLAESFGAGETLRGERIEMSRNDGRSLTMSINATPIRADNGDVTSVVVTILSLGSVQPGLAGAYAKDRNGSLERIEEELRTRILAVKGSAAMLLESLHTLDRTETALLAHSIDAQATQMNQLVGRPAHDGLPSTPSNGVAPAQPRDRALIVSHDIGTRMAAFSALSSAGFEVVEAADVTEAAARVADIGPRAVVVELNGTPDEGTESLSQLSEAADAPVIVVADHARHDAVDTALRAGAHDYIAAPLAAGELLARIRLAHARSGAAARPLAIATTKAVVGDLTLDLASGAAWAGDEPVRLSQLERRLLRELASEPGRILSHAELLRRVWGHEAPSSVSVVRSTIRRLRHKLRGGAPGVDVVVTVPRLGYRIDIPGTVP